MYSVSFEIKSFPKTLNEALRSHWTSYVRDSQRIGQEIHLQLRNKMPEKPLEKVAVTIERYSSGTLDRDNKFFTSKHILDNLVKLGVLANDTEANIKELTVNQVKISPKDQKKLMIRVEEVA